MYAVQQSISESLHVNLALILLALLPIQIACHLGLWLLAQPEIALLKELANLILSTC